MKYLFGDRVDRNISYQVFLALILVMFAVCGIDFLFLVLNELSDITESYNLRELLTYSIMSVPYRLFDLTAYFCLIGVVLGLGALADSGELTGARILGKSYISIALSAFKPILVLMFVGLLASEFFIPNLSQLAEENRLIKKEGEQLTKRYWIQNEIGFISFMSAPEKNKVHGLSIYELNSNNSVTRIINSKNASLKLDELTISNPKITYIDKRFSDHSNTYNHIKISGLDADFSLLLSPKYLSLTDLYAQIAMSFSKYRKNQLSLEFWRKILQPIVTLSLVLLALGFLFGPLKDQKSGQRIMLGIGVAFTVDLTQKLLGSISVVSNIPAFIAVLMPILLIAFLAFLLLRKVN